MLVSRIESVDKKKQRIWLEDHTCFSLYQKEVRELDIFPEADLSPEKYTEILQGILIPRAKKRAMHLLERRDMTESQLREKLKRNEYPQEAIDEAVSYVKGYHYIDDYRYACCYIRYRCESKAGRQLAMELYQKGISKEEVEKALEEEYCFEDENSKIEKWLRKKQYNAQEADVKQQQKMYQFLLRRGFSSEDILKVLHKS